jgi:hypothetical protein
MTRVKKTIDRFFHAGHVFCHKQALQKKKNALFGTKTMHRKEKMSNFCHPTVPF